MNDVDDAVLDGMLRQVERNRQEAKESLGLDRLKSLMIGFLLGTSFGVFGTIAVRAILSTIWR